MKAKKAKEPIKIRFKELADGNKSIYLDTYIGEGKHKYEFLKLYIIPEKTPFDKQQNKATMEAANAIKSKRIIELVNGEAGIKPKATFDKMLLSDLMQIYADEKRKKSPSLNRYYTVISTAESLEDYKPKTKLAEINEAFGRGYADFLTTASNKRRNGKLSKTTQQVYFSTFSTALNFAVRRGYIAQNPNEKLDQDERPHRGKSHRDYLTEAELNALISTSTSPKAKKPFLFSCFTGLRYGDIMRLEWGNIFDDNGVLKLRIITEKTKSPVIIPIPNAAELLPERGTAKNDDLIFDQITNTMINRYVIKWAEAAGIKGKHVTFHTARHTYATLLLTKGADLYTVSKLLGHTEIRTTQIYAEIIDKKKEAAASLLQGLI